jgi:hypothetical protein
MTSSGLMVFRPPINIDGWFMAFIFLKNIIGFLNAIP